ncbi:hypothetical protein [Flavobacterium sp.]|uniref:hypothetical protein n=1 Tax=Flavobacterium sp. TaxID=239 RepID=UPI004034DF80
MATETFLAIISLVMSTLIGIIQIFLAIKQKEIKKEQQEIKQKINNIKVQSGIIGNITGGSISNNRL